MSEEEAPKPGRAAEKGEDGGGARRVLLVGILCSGEQRSVHTLVWFQLIAKAGLWMVESERFLLWCRVLIFVSHSWGGGFSGFCREGALSNRGTGLAGTPRSSHSCGQTWQRALTPPSSCSSQLSPKELTPRTPGRACAEVGGAWIPPPGSSQTDRSHYQGEFGQCSWGGGRPDVLGGPGNH